MRHPPVLQLIAAYATGQISFEQLTASIQGWTNHVRYGNTIGLRKALLNQPLAKRRQEGA